MESLSNQYSSSSSEGPPPSKSESEGSDDFRVISVSTKENADARTQEPEIKADVTQNDKLERPIATNDVQISDEQLNNLQRWIESVNKESQGAPSFTEIVRQSKKLQNPAIFEKMISYCGIDEFGTNLKGRKSLDKSEYYKDICDVQELCMKDTD